MTPDDFARYVALLEDGADIALPLAGHAELVPLAAAIGRLADMVDQAIQGKKPADTLGAEAAAIRTSVQAEEDAKFPPKA